MVHVGVPKSGTTFLQTVLWGNRPALRHAGVLVPGRELFDGNRAATAVRVAPRPQAPPGSPTRVWQAMRREMREWGGTAVVSNEWFSLADGARARRAVEQLAPAEVHVVCTARDFVRLVPAAWQETLKLGRAQSLGSFIAGLDDEGERWSWSTLDPAAVLDRWGSSVPPDRVHVVTVPPPGSEPGLLWRRFATACGIEPDSCDLTVADPNESLGAESAALLQRLGPSLRTAVDADTAHWTEQYRWIRRYVGHELLVPQRGSAIRLRPAEMDVLRRRSRSSDEALRAAGFDVVGDLTELTSDAGDGPGKHPDDVTAEEMLEVAGTVVASLLRRVRDESPPPDVPDRAHPPR